MESPSAANASTFFHECDDLLAQVEETALAVQGDTPDPEAINRLFRVFHNIKGSGAMFGLDGVSAFTHHVETLLDRVRAGAVPVSSEVIEVVLAAKDHIQLLLAAAATDLPAPAPAIEAELVNRLDGLAGARAVAGPAPTRDGNARRWRVRFRPSPTTDGEAAQRALAEVRALGPHQLDAEPGGAFTLIVTTERGRDAILDAFIFLPDAELAVDEVTPKRSSAAVEVLPGFFMFPSAPRPAVAAPPPPVAAAPARATVAGDAGVRVASAKLDRLVNLVGELVISQSRLSLVSSRIESSELGQPVEELERLVAELRDEVLGVRMMPIGGAFARMKRLVHDLSKQLGKEIALVVEGAETELDKTVIDQLADPLVHLVRNAADHGLETAAERVAAGKPARGTIRLGAAQVGQNVVVTIADDGRGLDVAAIRAKAVERGLVGAGDSLPSAEIHKLIFHPGLSTAKQLTDVSGRGVGMDVVKRQIDALRGTVAISSTPGQGTSLAVTLPLTLAIIDGLVVEVARERYIIPLSAVTETVEIPRGTHAAHNGRRQVVVRNELVPYLRLRDAFGEADEGPALEKVVIVQQGEQRVGLCVDRVIGSHQTVIQSLGRLYRGIGVVSGATILGDGRVALILDLAGIVGLTRNGSDS